MSNTFQRSSIATNESVVRLSDICLEIEVSSKTDRPSPEFQALCDNIDRGSAVYDIRAPLSYSHPQYRLIQRLENHNRQQQHYEQQLKLKRKQLVGNAERSNSSVTHSHEVHQAACSCRVKRNTQRSLVSKVALSLVPSACRTLLREIQCPVCTVGSINNRG